MSSNWEEIRVQVSISFRICGINFCRGYGMISWRLRTRAPPSGPEATASPPGAFVPFLAKRGALGSKPGAAGRGRFLLR